MCDYLQHVHPVTLDLCVKSVEVNVSDHLCGDGRLEPAVAPKTDEHVLQWVGCVVPHLCIRITLDFRGGKEKN